MKNVVLYYSFSFALGGGEYLPLSFISELQGKCRLTVAVDMASNFGRSCEAFGGGLGIDRSAFEIVQVAPQGYNPRRHGALTSHYRFRRLKKLAEKADVCISAACIMDFGRPAHHFINMIDFGDAAFTAFAHSRPQAGGAAAKAKRFLSDSVLRPLLGMRSRRSIVCDPRERVYPNSLYVAGLMEKFYGRNFGGDVFYPPTLFKPAGAPERRDPLKVVYIGRIVPGKLVHEIVAVVEEARALSGLGFTFHAAGRIDQDPGYGRMLRGLAETRPWMKLEGALYGAEKERFLLSGSYAVHAERDEAFGISVAEYLAAGLVPVVPDEGGAREIVDDPALTCRDRGEAARILVRLASDGGFRAERLAACAARAEFFSKEAYLGRQRELLRGILDGAR